MPIRNPATPRHLLSSPPQMSDVDLTLPLGRYVSARPNSSKPVDRLTTDGAGATLLGSTEFGGMSESN